MKTDDKILTIGLVVGGGWVLWNMSKGFQGIGEGASTAFQGTGNLIGETATDTGKLIRTVTDESVRTTHNIFDIVNLPIESGKKLIDEGKKQASQALTTVSMGVSASMDKYLASQPKVLNSSQGTRKNLSLAKARGQTTVPLITKSGYDVKTVQVNVNQALQKTIVQGTKKQQSLRK